MKVITVISQKGGAGKTTLAIHLAAAGAGAGLAVLILDTDPQATASHWSEWRGSSDLEVVDCASPPLLPRKLQQAAELGADLVVIDTPPGSVAKIVKLEHAWRRLDGRNDDGFQVAPFPG